MGSILKTSIGLIQYTINMIKEDQQLSIRLRSGLRSIKYHLSKVAEEQYDVLQLQELACDIEDFMDCLSIPGALGPLLSAIGANPKDEYVHIVESFIERVKNLEERQQKSPDLGSSSIAGAASTPTTVNLVGLDVPIAELLELLSPLPAEEPQTKVISIVGCPGVGKTALARAVYNHPKVSEAFDCTVWVEVSECSQVGELLTKLLDAVRANHSGSVTLRGILKDKRYLVFVDDVKAPVSAWKHIVNNAFPLESKSSRIIMTTSIRSVAAACSSGRYVYAMPRLEQEDSKKLFWKKVYGSVRDEPVPALANSSEKIFSKCDGLPLAIISVAEDLSTKGGQSVEHLNSSDCEEAGETVSAFGEMGRAVKQWYDSLPDCHHKNCLLYLSIFPMGQVVKMNSVVRRLKSEGLGAQVSHRCLEELLDRCFVEPVESCWNSRVARRCKVHGVMLEYIIKLAMSKNLVTVCQENETLPVVDEMSAPRVRRLSIQSHIVKEYSRAEDIRSLTMFKSGFFKFTTCKMLRILDLQGCKNLDSGSLDGIWELRLLKYLSLRNSDITNLPKHIEKLQRLETLDIRETKPVSLDLPWNVIMLPKLAYLYGKFKLTGRPSRGTKELEEFLSHRSQLHTLAGLFINNTEQGIEDTIIRHAARLKKIKVWYVPAPRWSTPSPVPNPSSSIDPVPSDPAASSTRPHSADPPRSALASIPKSTTTTYSRAPAQAPKKSKSFFDRIRHLFITPRPKSSVGYPDPNPPTVNDSSSSSTFAADPTPSMDSGFPTSDMQIIPTPGVGASPGLTHETELNIIDLIPSIKQRFIALESVSIESNQIQITEDFLVSVLTGPSTVSSIKLRGQLQKLPNSSILKQVPPRNNLKSLQFFSCGLASQDLSTLQCLCCLEYLKLVEVDSAGFQGTDFTVQVNGFRSLKQLCFQAQKLPALVFGEGAMESLTSLQLLCPDSNQLQETARTMQGIIHAKYLNDVVLHHSANTETQDLWKVAIQEHPNRPSVKKQTEPKV